MKEPLLFGGVFVLTESVLIAGLALARKTLSRPFRVRFELEEGRISTRGAAAMLRLGIPGLGTQRHVRERI
jgi:hypothetical protein